MRDGGVGDEVSMLAEQYFRLRAAAVIEYEFQD